MAGKGRTPLTPQQVDANKIMVADKKSNPFPDTLGQSEGCLTIQKTALNYGWEGPVFVPDIQRHRNESYDSCPEGDQQELPVASADRGCWPLPRVGGTVGAAADANGRVERQTATACPRMEPNRGRRAQHAHGTSAQIRRTTTSKMVRTLPLHICILASRVTTPTAGRSG